MALIDDVKTALRISAGTVAFDSEISDLIAAAKADLQLSGVTAEKTADDNDPLIRRAVVTYVKANFGWDNPDADRLQHAYNLLKMHLTLSQEYSGYAVTFTVTDGVIPLENATIAFNGYEKITNSTGQTVFYGVPAEQNLAYTASLDGYKDATGYVDVSASTAVSVTMVVV